MIGRCIARSEYVSLQHQEGAERIVQYKGAVDDELRRQYIMHNGEKQYAIT